VTVYIPNKGSHDYSDAERFGDLRFLTSGSLSRYNTERMYRLIAEGLQGAEETDYLLISSLAILNALTSAVFSRKFGRVNYLLFRDGEYIEKTVMIDALL
jgi:hypothetical protein